MHRTPSIIKRGTHSSSITRQAQIISSTAVPLPQSPPRMRSTAAKSPGSPNSEKVKEWADIFDGPMRPAVFVPPKSTSSPSSPASTDKESVSSIMFDGPARPRYIIPGANIQNTAFPTQIQGRGDPGPSPTTQSRDVSALLSRSSLPPPRIYDGPAFEWEFQTKRV